MDSTEEELVKLIPPLDEILETGDSEEVDDSIPVPGYVELISAELEYEETLPLADPEKVLVLDD